ncbi:RND transporter, partial [Burkholderia glumae]
MRRPLLVVVLSLVIAALGGVYAVQHFRINTDVSKLLDNEPQWAALGDAIDQAFPQRSQTILAVVEAPAPEFASAAADALAAALDRDTRAGRIGQVSLPAGGPLFEHDALLFLSPAELASTVSKLTSARPLVNTLAKDPSVTGLATTLSTTLGQPLLTGQVTLPGMKTLLG